MPLYELRWMFKDAAVKAMTDRPQDREPPARELIESFGGKMHHYYFMLGSTTASPSSSSPTMPPPPRLACGRARRAPSRASKHTHL